DILEHTINWRRSGSRNIPLDNEALLERGAATSVVVSGDQPIRLRCAPLRAGSGADGRRILRTDRSSTGMSRAQDSRLLIVVSDGRAFFRGSVCLHHRWTPGGWRWEGQRHAGADDDQGGGSVEKLGRLPNLSAQFHGRQPGWNR